MSNSPRNCRKRMINIRLNEKEYRALHTYWKERKTTNHSRWIRETLMREVLGDWELNAPMLFSEEEMK